MLSNLGMQRKQLVAALLNRGLSRSTIHNEE